MNARIAIAACVLLALFPIVSHSEVWNVKNDFSGTQNPTGAWSYGWRNTGNDPFTLYTDTTPGHWCPDAGFEWWRCNIDDQCPMVFHNPFPYPLYCGTGSTPALCVALHPGPAQQSVVRWIAPREMQIQLAASFSRMDSCGPYIGRVVVHVYENGLEVFSQELDHWSQVANYAATVNTRVGDVIDCAVSPIDFNGDTTFLDLILTEVGSGSGACCFANGSCLVGTQTDCAAAGGTYMGDGTSCDPNPCGPVPVRNTSWGQIKSAYR